MKRWWKIAICLSMTCWVLAACDVPEVEVTAVPPTRTLSRSQMMTSTAVPPTPSPTLNPTNILNSATKTVFPVTRRTNLEEYDPSSPIIVTLIPTKIPIPTPIPTSSSTPTSAPTYAPPVLHPLAISPGNVEQIAEISQLGRGTIHKMAISPNRETISVVGGLGVWLYDLDTFELMQFIEQPHMVNTVDWSADGTRLVWGGEDSMVHVWNVATSDELQTWSDFNSAIWSLSLSPDGKNVAVGTVTGGLSVWHTDTGELNHQLGMDEYGRVWGISWAPDNVRFASAHSDGMVRIWDSRTGGLLYTFEAHHIPDTYYGGATIYHGVLSVAWSPDGQYVASSGSDDHKVRVWYAESGEELAGLLIDSIQTAHSMAWSPDGTQLALGSGWGSIALLNMATLDVASFFDKHAKAVHSLAWLPDSSQLLSGSIDTIKTGTPNQVLSGHTKPIQSLAWSPDNRFLAAGNSDVNIWDVDSATLSDTFTSSEDYYQLKSLAWSSDGTRLAWAEGEYGGSAQVWDVTQGNFIERARDGWGFGDGENGVYKVGWTINDQLLVSPWPRSDWSPDNLFVAVGQSSEINIYDMKTGEIHLILPGHEVLTLAIAWSPDRKWIASSGSHDQIIRIWDAASGTEQMEIVGSDTYDKLAWSPDSALLLGVNGNSISIWETANWEEMRRLEFGNAVLSIAFSPDGRILAIGSTDGTVRLWGIPVTGH